MGVRATGALIADVVIATGLPNSPRMIVLDFDADKKTVTTVWFSASGEAQEAVFPAAALERAPEEAPKKASRSRSPAPPVKPARKR